MYNSYALAIIGLPKITHEPILSKQTLWQRFSGQKSAQPTPLEDIRLKQRLQILNHFDLTVDALEASKVDLHLDMNVQDELIIIPLEGDKEIWLGWSMAPIQDKLLSTERMILPRFDGTFFTLDFENPMFSYQHIEAGRFGPGVILGDKVNKVRYFQSHDFPIPQFHERTKALTALANKLGIDETLVKRLLEGPRAKGLNGLAYDGNKNEWIIAKSTSLDPYEKPDTVIKLNPNSFKKKGKPITVAKHKESGLTYISQIGLFEMLLQQIIWQIFQFKVNDNDASLYNETFSNKECLRGKIRISNNLVV